MKGWKEKSFLPKPPSRKPVLQKPQSAAEPVCHADPPAERKRKRFRTLEKGLGPKGGKATSWQKVLQEAEQITREAGMCLGSIWAPARGRPTLHSEGRGGQASKGPGQPQVCGHCSWPARGRALGKAAGGVRQSRLAHGCVCVGHQG